MSVKTGATSKLAAFLLVSVNSFTMAACTFVFTVGLWTIASPDSLSMAIERLDSTAVRSLLPRAVITVQLGIALAGVAIFFFFVSFLGFYGAIGKSPFLLFMYSTLVIFLLLLECALVYYFTSSFGEKGLQEQDGQWTHALRLAFQCCEISSSSTEEVSRIPWSCCRNTGHNDTCTMPQLFTKDCHRTITSWINRYQTGIYASLTVLHLILSSCSIIRRRRSASRSYS